MAIVGVALVVAITGCLFTGARFPSTIGAAHARSSHDDRHHASDRVPGGANPGGRRHHHLKIVLTAKEYGTLPALEEVDSPSEIKCALVIGGVTTHDYPHVRMVTSLAKEHLHLLVKRDLADKGISGLRGKRIGLGPPTTASYHVSPDVLNFVGLLSTIETRSEGYRIDAITPQEAVGEMARIESLEGAARTEAIARLPDGVMFLAPLPHLLPGTWSRASGTNWFRCRSPRPTGSTA